MSMSLMSMLPISVLTSLFTMILQRKHLLMALLALEMMILCLVLFLSTFLYKNNVSDINLILGILTFGACEASLGLAILVNLMRGKGNDLITTTNSSKC